MAMPTTDILGTVARTLDIPEDDLIHMGLRSYLESQLRIIQAEIFEHLVAAAPQFSLRVFQEPTGVDMRALTAPRNEAAEEAKP